jgi:hypothetical protein
MTLATETNLDKMVERFFEHVITPPSGFAYTKRNGKMFLPVAHKNEWCMTLRDLATGETHPIFFTDEFLNNLTNALKATQAEFDKTIPKVTVQ